MKRLIIRGYYGRDNLGDELMKDIFIKTFKRPEIELMVMNSSPQEMYKEYGIETPKELITGHIPNIKVAIKRLLTVLSADLYVYGGGTILTDKHSCFHLIENACYFVMRSLVKRKSLLISVGATQFNTLKGAFFTKVLIRYSTKAYIRDEDSYVLLKEITNNSSKLVQSADMVLLSRDLIDKDREPTGEKIIGLCLMPYYYATYHDNTGDDKLLNELTEQIKLISQKRKEYKFLLIPIQYGKNDNTDYLFCEKIYRELEGKINIELSKAISSDEKISELIKCESIISMRLHALMISKLVNRKVCAINHNEKIHYFMKRYDSLLNTVSLDQINNLADCFLNLHVTKNNSNLDTDYKLAKVNLSIIKECLQLEE